MLNINSKKKFKSRPKSRAKLAQIKLYLTSVFVVLLFSQPAFADLESLKQQISDTKAGSLTSPELADYLVDVVFISEVAIEDVEARQFLGLAGFDQVLGARIYSRSTELFLETFSITEDLTRLKTLAEKVLPEDGDEARKITRLFKQVERALSIVNESKFTASDKFFESIIIEDERSYISLFLAKAWGNRAKEYTEKGETLNALKSYARGSQGVKPKLYLEAVKPLLQKVKDANLDFNDPELVKFFFLLGKADKTTAKEVTDYFSVLTLKALDAGNIEKAQSFYEKVLTLRPDPSPLNKELRKGIASKARNYETRLFALGRIEEMKSQGELNFGTKFFLFKHGMYWSGLKKWGFISICLIFIGALTLFVTSKIFDAKALAAEAKRKAEKRADKQAAKEAKESAKAAKSSKRADSTSMNFPKGASVAAKAALEQARMREEAKAAFAKPESSGSKFSFFGKKKEAGYNKPASGTDEYGKLLAVFDLTDEATEAEIKKAFRNKLKEYHPDITELEQEEAKHKTDELKLIYDRVREIRSSWFGRK